MSGLFEKKRQIRQKVLASVRELDHKNRCDFDLKIQNSFLNSDFFKNSKSLALYFPLPDEVSTLLIFEKCCLLGKEVAFPKVSLEKLDFYWVNSLDDFEKTKWGMQEPKRSLLKVSNLEKVDLIVVPGLAFDIKKYRLGRGKGFYDKALQNFRGQKVALAYSTQIVFELPIEAWDIPVDFVFCENQCIT